MRCGNSVGFSFLVFSLSIAVCRCGLLNLFDEWTNAIEPRKIDSGNKLVDCREKREVTVENEITPEIRSPDQTLSLIDIEEEKLIPDGQEQHAEGKAKSKRCPKEYVGISNPILGSPLLASRFGPLEKRQSRNSKEIPCAINDKACIINKKCMECQKICPANETNSASQSKSVENQILGLSPSKGDDIFSKTRHPVATYKEGETKDIICRIAGIKNPEDVESVIILVTTRSNEPPKILGGVQQELITTTQKGTQHLGPDIKPRFSDYDDTNEFGLSNSRISHAHPNPDLIEGPPPFMRNSNSMNDEPLGQSAPKEPENTQNEKDNTLGTSIDDKIIVQPKEFQSDESDEDDDSIMGRLKQNVKKNKLNTLKALRTPLESLKSNPKPSKGGFFQNLFMPHTTPEMKTSKPLTTPTLPVLQSRNAQKNNIPTHQPENTHINGALNDVKDMLKSMQEDAKKASEQRLLGAAHPSEHLIHKAVPPHVVKNVKDVNKYLIDRAQDALDTISTSNNDVNSNAGKHEHSQVTKDIITNFKKMPQYLLEKLRTTFDGLEKVTKPIVEDQKLGMSGRTAEANMKADEDDDDNDNESNLVGAPAQIAETTTEASTANPIKSKWDLYQEKLKERRQKLYSPEKYFNKLNKKPTLFKADEETKKQKENLKNKGLIKPAPVNAISRNAEIDTTDITLGEALPTESSNKPIFLPTYPTTINLINYLKDLQKKSQPTTVKSALDQLEINNNQESQPILGVVDPLNNLEDPKPALKDKLKNLVEDIVAKTSARNNLFEEKLQKQLANTKKALASQKMESSVPVIGAEEPSSLINRNSVPEIINQDGPATLAENTVNPKDLVKPLDAKEVQSLGSLLGADEPIKFIEATSQDPLPKKGILGDTLKNYLDDIKVKTAAKIDEANAKIGENVKQYLDNLKKPLEAQKMQPSVFPLSATEPASGLNTIDGKFNQIEPTEHAVLGQKLKNLKPDFTNNPLKNDELLKPDTLNGDLIKDKPLKAQDIEPTESTGATTSVNNVADVPNSQGETGKKTLLRNKLRNFVDDLKSRSSALSNRLGDLSNPDQQKKSLFKDKLKKYTKGLKKSSELQNVPSAKPRFGGAAESENTISDSMLGEAEPKKPTLRERMKTYVDSLNNLPKRMPEGAKRPQAPADFIRKDSKLPTTGDQKTITENTNPKTLTTGVSSPLDNENTGNNDIVLGSPNDFKKEDNVKEWTNSLGQIVHHPSNPKDIFFLGSGVKLPLKISHKKDGSMDLSVDLEKLCSCHNSTTCPANQTSIDETVGAILEKEAELKEQLGTEEDAPKKEKRSSPLLSKIFKRSVPEDILKTTYDNTVQQLQDRAKYLGDEVAKNMNTILQNPTLNLENVVRKTEDVGSNFMKNLYYEKLLNPNVLPDVNEMINRYEKDRIMKKMLNSIGIERKNFNPQEGLKKLSQKLEESQADITNKIGNKLENLQNQIMPDWYQKSKINLLQDKLKELDNKISKYETVNGNVFAKESQKILGQQPNRVVARELNIIKNVFAWISGLLGKSDNE